MIKKNILTVFIACVIACTFLSRAASSILTPHIETVTPSNQEIFHEFQTEGTIEVNKRQQVYIPDGLLIDEICVLAGDDVEEGDALARYNMDMLESEYEAGSRQMMLYESQKSLNAQRQAEYNQAVADAANYEALIVSQNGYINGLENEIESERQKREEDIAHEMESLNILNLSYARQINKLTQPMADADVDYYNSLIMSNQMRLQQLQTEISLLQNFEASGNKDQLLELAREDLAGLQEELSRIETARDTAKGSIMTRMELDALEADMETCQRSLTELDGLIQNGGILYSDVKGQILNINIAEGEHSSDTAAFCIADPSYGFYISTKVSRSNADYVAAGDQTEVTIGEKEETCTVESVNYNEKEECFDIRIILEGETYQAGTNVTVNFYDMSDKEGYSLPAEAVRSDRNGTFVLIIGYRDGLLGEEMIASRVGIKVLDSNNSSVVVSSGSLSMKDAVIVNSSKPVEAGDPVRYLE